MADVLKSYLAQHRVHLLAEITPEALAVLRRRDRALAECFHLLPVGAMDESTTLRILQQIVSDIEAERRVYFQPSVLPAILEKMRTLAPHLSFPGKGVEVVKNLSRWSQSSIQMSSLIAYLKQSTGVSTRMLDPTSRSHIPLRDSLEQRLVGQPQAIEAVERVAHRACYRLSPNDRPHGVLLFLGPTGVGKTECAKSLNAALFADDSHLLRFDMNEITTSHAAEQLIGTFENPDGRLTAAVRRRPFSVLLLDEIEKAHPDVFDYLLQVIGEGRLTDAHGRTIDFRNTVIIMTSNLGVQEDQSNMGFESQSEGLERDRQLAYERSAQRFFRPEFFNRIDEVVVFRRLERKDIRSIAELQLQQLLQRDGMLRREIFARVQQEVMDWVVERGFDRELGARAIKRALETHLVEPLGDLLSQTSSATSLWADISLRDNKLPSEERAEKEESEELVKVSGPIRCRLHPLRNLSKPAPRKSHTLSEWITFAESKLATYTEHLAQLQKSIQASSEIDAPPKVQGDAAPLDRVQYYTFHDQLFRCKEVLKELKRCANQSDTPLIQPMQSSPSAVKRNSTFRTAGERRHMIDYQSERDIHEAIADSHSFLGQARNVKESIDLMHRTLSLTHSMLEHVHQPLHWKLEMHYLTTPQRFAATGPEAHPHQSGEDFALQFDNVQLSAVIGYWDQYSNPAANYLRALANTLSSVFQYEVSYDLRQPFELSVSGIGVAGLLKALAGTYRMESPILGRELGVLVASPASRDFEPDAKAKGPPWWDPYGPLAACVPFDWTEVRGTLGDVVDHYHSSSTIAFQDSRQRWGWWWNDLLPSVEPA